MSRELKAHRIAREISDLKEDLIKHQERCKHIKATKKHHGDTGNYDPSENCYWTVFTCPTCLKIWHVDGSV